MSHFSMCVPTKSTVKFSNGNTVHDQLMETILCYIYNCPITYPVGPVYYFLCHHYNNISLDALNFYVDFKKVTSEPLEHCDFVDPQNCSWISPHHTGNNLQYLVGNDMLQKRTYMPKVDLKIRNAFK